MRTLSRLAAALLLCAACAAPLRADESPPLPASRWRAFQTGALRADRIQHASLAFTAGLGAGIAGAKPAGAFGVAAGLGLFKELVDLGGSGFDWLDLAAGLAGAGGAALATRSLER